jgi:hypothetical protein
VAADTEVEVGANGENPENGKAESGKRGPRSRSCEASGRAPSPASRPHASRSDSAKCSFRSTPNTPFTFLTDFTTFFR